jgi:hypothetical protein
MAQSKLWFNDGLWWGVLFNRSSEEYHIYRYERASHSWNDTGTLVEERNFSKADVLRDGDHLYAVSAGPNNTNSARVSRYSYYAASDMANPQAAVCLAPSLVVSRPATGEVTTVARVMGTTSSPASSGVRPRAS